jgi:hypothetical protein
MLAFTEGPNLALAADSQSLRLKSPLSRPRAASTMLRMIIRKLLDASRVTTMRMQQSIPPASKLASGLAPDPQRWVLNYEKET